MPGLILFDGLMLAMMGGIIFVTLRAYDAEGEQEIRKWALAKGMKLSLVWRKLWILTPFILQTSTMHRVFYIEATTSTGEHKKGWVRIGGLRDGLTVSSVVVEWDWP